jgi:hypothetical protein
MPSPLKKIGTYLRKELLHNPEDESVGDEEKKPDLSVVDESPEDIQKMKEKAEAFERKKEDLIIRMDVKSPHITEDSAEQFIRDFANIVSSEEVAVALVEACFSEKKYAHLDFYLADRMQEVMDLLESEYKKIFFDIVRDFSPVVFPKIVDKIREYGSENSNHFFEQNKKMWEEDPSTRWATIEEFLLDGLTVQEMAKNEIAMNRHQTLEAPEATGEDMEVAVVLEIPGIQYAPDWWSLDQNTYKRIRNDHDDEDYILPSELPAIDFTGPGRPRESDYQRLLSAIKSGDTEKRDALIEKVVGLGEIPPDKKEKIISSIDFVMSVYLGDEEAKDPLSKWMQETLRGMRYNHKLPDSAGSLEVHHRVLDRTRTIPPFEKTILPHLMEVIVSGAVQLAREDDGTKNKMEQKQALGNLADQVMTTELQARKMYKKVVEKGVPVFQDYVSWLNEEVRKTEAKGEEHPGEFYVGRDTYQTLFPAAKSMRWGEMEGGKMRQLTVYVNVSRPLLNNMGGAQEMKAIMKQWLEDEGVTQRMYGIDGGYSGSGPMGVFRSLEEGFSYEQGDEQIHLLESSNPRRRIDLRNSLSGFVSWMEALPKFADRSQKVVKSEFGRWMIEDESRTPAERVLAWTVQHAVWREMINFVPEDRSPKGPPPLPEDEPPKIVLHQDISPARSFWGSQEVSIPMSDNDDVEMGVEEKKTGLDTIVFPKTTLSYSDSEVSLKKVGWATPGLRLQIGDEWSINIYPNDKSDEDIIEIDPESVKDFWGDVIVESKLVESDEQLFEIIKILTEKHFPLQEVSAYKNEPISDMDTAYEISPVDGPEHEEGGYDYPEEESDSLDALKFPVYTTASTGKTIYMTKNYGWQGAAVYVEILDVGYIELEDKDSERRISPENIKTFWKSVETESKLVESNDRLLDLIEAIAKAHLSNAKVNKVLESGDDEWVDDDYLEEYGW